jgi:hypothetical protein
MAMVQVRRPSAGQAYYRRKPAEGKSPKEACAALNAACRTPFTDACSPIIETWDPGRVRPPEHERGPLEGDPEPAGRRHLGLSVALHYPLPTWPGAGLSEIAGFEGQRIDVREKDVRVLGAAGDATDRQDRAIRLSGAVVS